MHDRRGASLFVDVYIVIVPFRTIFSVTSERLVKKFLCMLYHMSMGEICVHVGNKLWHLHTKMK